MDRQRGAAVGRLHRLVDLEIERPPRCRRGELLVLRETGAGDRPLGALNLAALNVANVLGAEGGAATISAGWGTLSTVWAGFLFTSAGLVLYATAVPRTRRSPSPVVPTAVPAVGGESDD
jgi:hypothetical protein